MLLNGCQLNGMPKRTPVTIKVTGQCSSEISTSPGSRCTAGSADLPRDGMGPTQEQLIAMPSRKPSRSNTKPGRTDTCICKELQIEIVRMLSHSTLNGITAELIGTIKADAIEESVIATERNGAVTASNRQPTSIRAEINSRESQHSREPSSCFMSPSAALPKPNKATPRQIQMSWLA